jgi:hypothetical protein
LTLRYEDVLDQPVKYLRASAEFCGLRAPDNKLREAVAGIKADRALSYLSDAKLRQFALDHEAELSERGYGRKSSRSESPARGIERPKQWLPADSLAGRSDSARAPARPQ